MVLYIFPLDLLNNKKERKNSFVGWAPAAGAPMASGCPGPEGPDPIGSTRSVSPLSRGSRGRSHKCKKKPRGAQSRGLSCVSSPHGYDLNFRSPPPLAPVPSALATGLALGAGTSSIEPPYVRWNQALYSGVATNLTPFGSDASTYELIGGLSGLSFPPLMERKASLSRRSLTISGLVDGEG